MKLRLIAMLCAGATLLAQTNARITGRITSEGAPLRGEVVAVTGGGAVRMSRAGADTQGAFAIDVAAGEVRLLAKADGYVSEERVLLARAGTHNPAVLFVLSPAGSVSGRVFDGTGAGVPGARVWVDYRGESRRWRLGEEAGGEAADSLGGFTIPVVARGKPFVLHVGHEEWLPSSSGTLVLRTPEMPGVVLLLSRRGGSVRGVVADAAGKPIAGALVRLRIHAAKDEFTAEQRASIPFAHCTNKTAISAPDGSYHFAGVPVGRVVVTAHAGALRSSAEATAAAGRETVIALTVR